MEQKKDDRVNIKIQRKYLPSYQALKSITKAKGYGDMVEKAVEKINAKKQ